MNVLDQLRDAWGRFAVRKPICRETAPLLHVRRARSARVAKGNTTRRINAMRRARLAMLAAPDFPGVK